MKEENGFLKKYSTLQLVTHKIGVLVLYSYVSMNFNKTYEN